VAELVDETYAKRETELGSEVMRAVERWVLLRTIDTHWIEHLTAMEELREGIHLRGYGQQDPLVAYKNEAHRFYEEMQTRIGAGVAQTILRVSVKTAEQAATEEASADASPAAGGAPAGSAAPRERDHRHGGPSPSGTPPAASRTASGAGPDGHKIGRNDPCHCGSGKKFKKCHGR